MTFTSSLVSVIIPLFNHSAFVEACVLSIVQQTYAQIELIIIDDHSTDGSFELAHQLLATHKNRFTRTLLVQNTRNRGAVFSLNRGIGLAKGKTLAFLNSDDLFEANRLARMLAAMDRENRPWAFSSIAPIGADGDAFWHNREAHKFAIEPALLCQTLPAPSWALLHFQASISTGNIVVDRQLAHNVGGFFPLRYCHDWAFVLACAWHHEPAFVDAPLYQYRFHGNNSFSDLGHIGSADTAALLRAHCVRAFASVSPNTAYPTQRFGSVLYEKLASELGIDGLHESLYQPYAKHHRTISA
jgi:glycosyltransferase involved in cell wall biosynthesis